MYKNVKRGIDIGVSFFSLLVLFPLFLVITLMIKTESKGTAIFRQRRLGKNKKYFEIFNTFFPSRHQRSGNQLRWRGRNEGLQRAKRLGIEEVYNNSTN